jgi:hypothetical protein
MKPWFLAASLPRLGRVQAFAGMILVREVGLRWGFLKWKNGEFFSDVE